MAEIPYSIRKSINKYEPIEMDGLTFYPIRVDEYEAFMMARFGIEVLQQSLPLQYISMPLLSALYQLDYDAVTRNGNPTGLFSRVLLFLALSLRLGEGLDLEARLGLFRMEASPSDPSKFVALRIRINGDEYYRITPVQFARYRPILAAQNGIDLEQDDANPDIIRSAQEQARKRAPDLDVSIESVVASVAALTGEDEADIYDWPILKLERRRDALQRAVDYIVCGINEGAGCKWPNGNPVPSMWYARNTKFNPFIGFDDFTKGQNVSVSQGGAPQDLAAIPQNF